MLHSIVFPIGSLSEEGKTFGKTISRGIELAGPDAVVPKVISDCVNRLLSDCLDIEGLFRVPGGMEEVHQLRRHYDGGMWFLFVAR
jgi:RhoGAP domain